MLGQSQIITHVIVLMILRGAHGERQWALVLSHRAETQYLNEQNALGSAIAYAASSTTMVMRFPSARNAASS